ncbi:hypothetical protein CUC08_Gglean000810 [Alternaria sp. MG1]|nr:hypothetical protein CUC08_Gglean000810 [Alternaria sp. MG1]
MHDLRQGHPLAVTRLRVKKIRGQQKWESRERWKSHVVSKWRKGILYLFKKCDGHTYIVFRLKVARRLNIPLAIQTLRYLISFAIAASGEISQHSTPSHHRFSLA